MKRLARSIGLACIGALAACSDSPGTFAGSGTAGGGSDSGPLGSTTTSVDDEATAPGTADGETTGDSAASEADSASETGVADSGTASGSTGGEPICGDGVVDGDEGCDDGGVTARCTAWCQPPGALLWEYALGPSNANPAAAPDITVDAEGHIVLVAHEDLDAMPSISVVRLDNDGTLVDTTPLTDDSENNGNCSVAAADGIAAAGPEVLTRFDDTSLAEQWSFVLSPTEDYSINAVVATDDATIFAGLGGIQGVGLRPWIGRIDSTGATAWDTIYTSANWFPRPRLAPAPGGVKVMWGTSFDLNAPAQEICDVSTAGEIDNCWDFDVGGRAEGFVFDEAGNAYVAGFNPGHPLAWRIASFEADGTPRWQTTLFEDKDKTIGTGYHYARGIAIRDDQLVLSGSIRTAVDAAHGALAILSMQDGAPLALIPEAYPVPIDTVAIASDGGVVGTGYPLEGPPYTFFAAKWAL